MPVLFLFRYFDYYKAKPSGNHQLYKVGSNLSADLNHKQYKQASTRIFLTATTPLGGGRAKQITLLLTWDKWKSSPQINVNTKSQVIAKVKGMINVSS